MIEDHNT